MVQVALVQIRFIDLQRMPRAVSRGARRAARVWTAPGRAAEAVRRGACGVVRGALCAVWLSMFRNAATQRQQRETQRTTRDADHTAVRGAPPRYRTPLKLPPAPPPAAMCASRIGRTASGPSDRSTVPASDVHWVEAAIPTSHQSTRGIRQKRKDCTFMSKMPECVGELLALSL